MDDIDPTSIPFVPPGNVSLIQTDNGRPKQSLMDWFQGQQAWFVQAAVDLQTKITTVESQTGDNTAKIEDLTYAITTDDSAYASRINNVIAQSASNNASITSITFALTNSDVAYAGRIDTAQVRSDYGSASGDIQWLLTSGPGGTTAAYSLYLTAGAAFCGFQMLVDSFGNSSIGLTASKFYMVDSGTAEQVFLYGNGLMGLGFYFNAPVYVQNKDITDNAVSNSASSTGNPADVAITLRAASRVQIIGTYLGDTNNFTTVNKYVVDIINGNTGITMLTAPCNINTVGTGGSATSEYGPTTIVAEYAVPSAGTYTFRTQLRLVVGTPVSLSFICNTYVTELSK